MAKKPAHEIAARLDPPRPYSGIGVIAPYDFALDRELWQLVPDDVTVHVTRTPHINVAVSTDQATALADSATLTDAADTLSAVRPASTVYLCTSASFVHGMTGEARLREAIQMGGVARAVTPGGALLEAISALGVRRIGVGTPYDQELTSHLDDFLEEAGVQPMRTAYLGMTGNIRRVTSDTVDALAHAAADGADAIFLACTNLRTISLIPKLERDLGIPVLSATLVSMWSALQSIETDSWGRPEQLFTRTGPTYAASS